MRIGDSLRSLLASGHSIEEAVQKSMGVPDVSEDSKADAYLLIHSGGFLRKISMVFEGFSEIELALMASGRFDDIWQLPDNPEDIPLYFLG